MSRKLTGAALGGALLVAPHWAAAHVYLETAEAPANGSYKAVLRVPHGCDGNPTTALRVQIPEGVIAVKPMPKPGWQVATVKDKYARAYDYFGSELTEGVREISWSGGELPDDFYDEFVFIGGSPTSRPAPCSISRRSRTARAGCTAGSRSPQRGRIRTSSKNPRRS